jgi:hypothetical protein
MSLERAALTLLKNKMDSANHEANSAFEHSSDFFKQSLDRIVQNVGRDQAEDPFLAYYRNQSEFYGSEAAKHRQQSEELFKQIVAGRLRLIELCSARLLHLGSLIVPAVLTVR